MSVNNCHNSVVLYNRVVQSLKDGDYPRLCCIILRFIIWLMTFGYSRCCIIIPRPVIYMWIISVAHCMLAGVGVNSHSGLGREPAGPHRHHQGHPGVRCWQGPLGGAWSSRHYADAGQSWQAAVRYQGRRSVLSDSKGLRPLKITIFIMCHYYDDCVESLYNQIISML